jgi:hypothetical protein
MNSGWLLIGFLHFVDKSVETAPRKRVSQHHTAAIPARTLLAPDTRWVRPGALPGTRDREFCSRVRKGSGADIGASASPAASISSPSMRRKRPAGLSARDDQRRPPKLTTTALPLGASSSRDDARREAEAVAVKLENRLAGAAPDSSAGLVSIRSGKQKAGTTPG